jgi:hypothetical protein
MNSNQLESSKTISPSSLSSASSLSNSPSTSTLLSIPYKSYNIDNDDKISNITNCYIPQYNSKSSNQSAKNDLISCDKLYAKNFQEIELKKQIENENKRLINNHISSNNSNIETFKAIVDEPIKNDNLKNNFFNHQTNFYDYLMNIPYRNFNSNDTSSISQNKAFNIESLVMNNNFRNSNTHHFNSFSKDSFNDKSNKSNEQSSISLLDPVKLAYIMNNSMNDSDKNTNLATSPVLPLNSQIVDYVQIYQNSLGLNR